MEKERKITDSEKNIEYGRYVPIPVINNLPGFGRLRIRITQHCFNNNSLSKPIMGSDPLQFTETIGIRIQEN